MKIAYLCEPQLGGTYTFFKSLRGPLRELGIDFCCVAPIRKAVHFASPYAADDGVVALDIEPSDSGFASIAADHLIQGDYAGVMALANVYDLRNVFARLPESIFRLIRLPHNAKGVYDPAIRYAPMINRYVAVSDRLKDDLVHDYGVPEDRISVIYHGVDTNLFSPAVKEHGADDAPTQVDDAIVRLLYAGRLENSQKCIFILPKILRLIRDRYGVSARLSVAGDGPDKEALSQRVQDQGLEQHVNILGMVKRDRLPELMRSHSILILPSRFEGCGFTLLEAMSCGCVPVASRIRSIFDRIIEDSVSGALCEIDNADDFAGRIAQLAANRDRLKQMSDGARNRVLTRFSINRMAGDYALMFRMMAGQKRTFIDGVRHRNGNQLLRTAVSKILPVAIKDRIRTMAERAGRSI